MPERVLLITPPYHCGVVESAGRWPNLAFIYIAGELEKVGFEVEIYDAMSKFHTFEQIREHIREFKPDFVGTTAITATIADAIEVLRIAKDEFPSVKTFMGGVHPTFLYEEILERDADVVDCCVLGEGEITARELLIKLSEGRDLSRVEGIAFKKNGTLLKTPARAFVEDLDSLSPAWHLVNWSDYPLYFIDNSTVAIVSSSRGCTHECSFCSQHKFWQGSYRERDPEKFVSEIEHINKTYGVNIFFIADEYPTRSRERWEKILDLLIECNLDIHILLETCVTDILRDRDIIHKYRKAKVLFIYIGVEATSNQTLEAFKKEVKFEESKEAIRIIKNEGMIVESSLILGLPEETHESIAETLELAKEYDSDFMHFLLLAPWPYADMYEKLKPYIVEKDYSKYNLIEPVIKPVNMTLDELMNQVLNCYKEYYMRKLPQWLAMEGNDLKKSTLLRGMKAIVENSFLKDHMKGLGEMPQHVRNLVEDLDL